MNNAFSGTAKTKIRHTPACSRCHIEMKKGTALVNGWSGYNDFVGDPGVVTLHPNPKLVSIVNCWKCPKCGHSIGRDDFTIVA